jgi:hypothetical protein
VSVTIALHNIPEECAMAVPAVAVKNRALLFKATILSGLAELASAIFGMLAVHVNPLLNPTCMAFAAGAMVMVPLFELVPMARKYGGAGFFTLGLATRGLVCLALQCWFQKNRVGNSVAAHAFRGMTNVLRRFQNRGPTGIVEAIAGNRQWLVKTIKDVNAEVDWRQHPLSPFSTPDKHTSVYSCVTSAPPHLIASLQARVSQTY